MTRTYDDALPTRTIYAAENNVARMIQRGGAVEFFGSTLSLRDCKIDDLTPASLHIWRGVVEGLYERHRRGTRLDPPEIVVSHRAYHRAWYSPATHTITLPMAQWAWSSFVLMHELAHALSDCGHNQRSAHGHIWRKTYCALVAEIVGPEAGLLLQAAMDL
jgi:putative metallohydrolase (TIGR04338 family)